MPVNPFQPAIGCVDVRFYGMLFGQQVINHITFKVGVGVQASQAEVANLAFACDTIWGGAILGLLSSDYDYIKCVATGLTVEQDWQVKAALNGGVGGIDQPSLPGGNALRINYDAGVRGRSAHWGTQVAGIPKNNYDGNSVAVDWAASVKGAFAPFLTISGDVPGAAWVVLQRQLNGVRLASATAIECLGASLNSYKVGTQDTRMAGHGQ